MHLAPHLAVDCVDTRRDREGAPLITYLTTDPKALGVLAWISSVITVLGFVIAIWQIRKVKRAADAARDAALGLANRVRSRELLALLSGAHNHLETARNRAPSGSRDIVALCLELSIRSIIDAREISGGVLGPWSELQGLIVRLRQANEQLVAMSEPLPEDAGFLRLCRHLRDSSETLQRCVARSRYAYDIDNGD
jgi:hypothetical protein